MKTFIASALIGAAVANPLPFVIPDLSTLTTVEYNTMVSGVVYGALNQKGETAMETCLVDADAEGGLSLIFFEDIKQGLIQKAFVDLKSLVTSIPSLKTTCSQSALQANILDLEAWATFFERPESIVIAAMTKNWMLHSIAMTKDMNKATNYWNAGEYFLFGEEVGIMAVILSS